MTTRPRNRRLFARTSRNLKHARPGRRAILPFMESLEHRLVLANFVLTTLADVDSPGQLTLRDAINPVLTSYDEEHATCACPMRMRKAPTGARCRASCCTLIPIMTLIAREERMRAISHAPSG